MWADRPDENASFPGTCESFGLSLSESRVQENRMHGLIRGAGTRLDDMCMDWERFDFEVSMRKAYWFLRRT